MSNTNEVATNMSREDDKTWPGPSVSPDGSSSGVGAESGSSGSTLQSCQQYCLRWNNHQQNLLTVFEDLLQTEAFVDVTLTCEGLQMKAHKMVLGACSPYFQSLLFNSADRHPIVYLKDVRFGEMKALLDFMYRGEVSVNQENLNSLLKVAESLQIKGLADVSNEGQSCYTNYDEDEDTTSVEQTKSNMTSPFPRHVADDTGKMSERLDSSMKSPPFDQYSPLISRKVFDSLAFATPVKTPCLSTTLNSRLSPHPSLYGDSMGAGESTTNSVLSSGGGTKRKRARPRRLSGSSAQVVFSEDHHHLDNKKDENKNSEHWTLHGDNNGVHLTQFNKRREDMLSLLTNNHRLSLVHQQHHHGNQSNSSTANGSSFNIKEEYSPPPLSHEQLDDDMPINLKRRRSPDCSAISKPQDLRQTSLAVCGSPVRREEGDPLPPNPVTTSAVTAAALLSCAASLVAAQNNSCSTKLSPGIARPITGNDTGGGFDSLHSLASIAASCGGVSQLASTAVTSASSPPPPNFHSSLSPSHPLSVLQNTDELSPPVVKTSSPSLGRGGGFTRSHRGASGIRQSRRGRSRGRQPRCVSPFFSLMSGDGPTTTLPSGVGGINIVEGNTSEASMTSVLFEDPEKYGTKSFSEMSVRGLDLLRYAAISEDGTYRCLACERLKLTKFFKNKYSFQRHAFLYHEGVERKVFPCPICQKEFSRPDKMKSHLKTAHGQQFRDLSPIIPSTSTVTSSSPDSSAVINISTANSSAKSPLTSTTIPSNTTTTLLLSPSFLAAIKGESNVSTNPSPAVQLIHQSQKSDNNKKVALNLSGQHRNNPQVSSNNSGGAPSSVVMGDVIDPIPNNNPSDSSINK